MKNRSGAVSFMYGTVPGRLLLKLIMGLRLDKPAVFFLRSPLSKPVIAPFARKNNIPLTAEQLAGITESYPNVDVSYTLELLGQEVGPELTELDLSGLTPEQLDENLLGNLGNILELLNKK